MDGIELMVEEHVNIKRMLTVVRNACYGIMNGADINYDDFEEIIDFIRNYADDHHHAKEEKFLFNKMVSEIGEIAEKLIKYGMLVEHDLGRLYIMNLEIALTNVKNGDDYSKIDVIANAVGYTNLLTRHIDKEDTLVYTFARKNLLEGTINIIDEECLAYENTKKEQGTQNKYLEILDRLERKYNN